MQEVTQEKLIQSYKHAIITGNVFLLQLVVDKATDMDCLKEVLSKGMMIWKWIT